MKQKNTNKNMVDVLERIKQEQLLALKPLKFAVNEICNCLIAKHEVAAFTLTNYLFEASLKLTLIYWESGGKLIENINDFESLYRNGTKKYLAKDVYKAIGSAKRSEIITEEEGKELLFFLHHYRDPFSHASNNSEINESKVISFDDSMINKTITVNGNPLLYFNYQERYMRNSAHRYFFKLYSYIKKWDGMICELREKANYTK
jgi:hypothetical protein